MEKATKAQKLLLARAELEDALTYEQAHGAAGSSTIRVCIQRGWLRAAGEADCRWLYALTDAGRAALEEATEQRPL